MKEEKNTPTTQIEIKVPHNIYACVHGLCCHFPILDYLEIPTAPERKYNFEISFCSAIACKYISHKQEFSIFSTSNNRNTIYTISIESLRTPHVRFKGQFTQRCLCVCVCVFFHSFYFNTNTIYTLWMWSKLYERKRALTLVHITPWNASLCVCLLVHWCVCAKHTKIKWKKPVLFSSFIFQKEFFEIRTHSFGAGSILLCAGWLRKQFNHQPKR